MAGSDASHLLFSRSGHLWIASSDGVSRLDPRLERPASPTPPVLITRLRVAGDVVPLDKTGTSRPAALELQPSRNNLDVQFVALRYGANPYLHYQYKLDGVDDDWSARQTSVSCTSRSGARPLPTVGACRGQPQRNWW